MYALILFELSEPSLIILKTAGRKSLFIQGLYLGLSFFLFFRNCPSFRICKYIGEVMGLVNSDMGKVSQVLASLSPEQRRNLD